MKPKPDVLIVTVTLLTTVGMHLSAKPVAAQRAPRSEVSTLAPGSAARKKFFDTLRPNFEKDLHQKVIFTAPTLRITQGWAFVNGQLQQSNHKPIDYRKTKFSEGSKLGMVSNDYCALLRAMPGNRWKVVTYHIGQTDVYWEDWPQKFHAPAILFK